MKKLLMFVILAIALLCLTSTVSATKLVEVEINPTEQYTTPEQTVEYTVTVYNNYKPTINQNITISFYLGKCYVSWFEVDGITGTKPVTLVVPSGGFRSLSIKITPDKDASGRYDWGVSATAHAVIADDYKAAALVVGHDYDYVGETYVEGTGIFTIDKRLRSSTMSTIDAVEKPFHVNVEKHFECRGSIDGFANNQYLLKEADGNNPNFKQVSMVDNYEAIEDDDYFSGDEDLRSSFIFGGTGARIKEEFIVRAMEERLENINLHCTGDQGYMTEIDSYNDFDTGLSEGYGGYFSLDARQSIPGIRIEESETFYGDLIVHKHLIFRRPPDDTFRDPGC